MKRFNLLKFIRIIVYIILLGFLIFLGFSADATFGLCHIKENFGLLCPSCGITRATKAILSLNFASAIEYNAYFTLVLLPAFLCFLVDDVICMLFKRKSMVDVIFESDTPNIIYMIIVLIFVLFIIWNIFRNI